MIKVLQDASGFFDTQRSGFKRPGSEFSLISVVPVDIFRVIFDLLFHDAPIWKRPSIAITLSQVSRYFKDAARNMPILWTVIDTYQCKTPELLQMFLQNSQALPLDIRFTQWNDRFSSDPMGLQLIKETPRWRRLVLTSEGHIAENLRFLQQVFAPLLKNYDIYLDPTSPPLDEVSRPGMSRFDDQELVGFYGLLNSLTLLTYLSVEGGWEYPDAAHFVLPCLEVLHVKLESRSYDDQPLSFPRFWYSGTTAPRLKTLHLEHCRDVDIDPSNIHFHGDQTVLFPALTHLIVEAGPPSAGQVLSRARMKLLSKLFPHITHLVLIHRHDTALDMMTHTLTQRWTRDLCVTLWGELDDVGAVLGMLSARREKGCPIARLCVSGTTRLEVLESLRAEGQVEVKVVDEKPVPNWPGDEYY
ncbi:hypothetical protein H0H81_010476 [Sphagnurus paluster]|uniref:F-box domain-containing protein n=1 Tax=Sphagnurus paluster TaxID=117069 RepID=A0A9P7KIJ1_9AGAR|nr:hypothetical protein H0H81_010476 [Sphagnurus paluster]